MAQQARVPKFGNWENEGEVPYTKYFNDARKGKNAGKMINPNDPEENPEAFTEDVPPADAAPVRSTSVKETPKAKEERRVTKGDDAPRRRAVSPLQRDTQAPKTSASLNNRHGDRGDIAKRHGRMSAGSDRSLEQAPLHNHQLKPAAERRNLTEGSNTPGRSRMNTGGRMDEKLEEGSVLPKFGDWDEGNPSTAEGYTHIFNIVREEKQTGMAPISRKESPYNNKHTKNKSHDKVKCSCFGWLGK